MAVSYTHLDVYKRQIDDRFYTLHIFENSGLMLRKEKEFVGLVDMKENVLYCNYYGMHNYKRIQEEFTLKANGIEAVSYTHLARIKFNEWYVFSYALS